MVLIENYFLAVFGFVFCMTCWGSWSNTQKLASKTWRFELFYWDFVIGLGAHSTIVGGHLGKYGGAWPDVFGRIFSKPERKASFMPCLEG